MSTQVWIALVTRFCLGLFFVASAIGKFLHWNNFRAGVRKYEILPSRFVRIAGITLPFIELVLASALVLGTAIPVVGLASALLLAAFILGIAINLRRGRFIECNCYGIAGTNAISRGTIVRNILLIALALTTTAINLTGSRSDGLREDRAVFSSLGAASVVFLVLGSIVVSIALIEWMIAISDRSSQLSRT